MRKILVFGTGYFDTELKIRLLKLWNKLLYKENLDDFYISYVLIDSKSPIDIKPIFEWWSYKEIGEDLESVELDERKTIISFSNNAGHLCNRVPYRSAESITGDFGDGAGRAFCEGFKIAIENKFDYVIHLECDMLYFGNYLNIVKKMVNEEIPYISAICPNFNAHENNVMFASTKFLKEIDFINKYNWHIRDMWPLSEQRIQSILGSSAYYHSFNGRRVEGSISNEFIIKDIEAGTLDYITKFDDELLEWIEKWIG